VRKVVHGAAANEYKTSSLILEIVKSLPFQNRVKNSESGNRVIG
jgi:hypothetical protein